MYIYIYVYLLLIFKLISWKKVKKITFYKNPKFLFSIRMMYCLIKA